MKIKINANDFKTDVLRGVLIPFLLTVIITGAGCSPSVRYTRERSAQSPSHVQGSDDRLVAAPPPRTDMADDMSAWGADHYADGRVVPPTDVAVKEQRAANDKREKKAARKAARKAKAPDLLEQVANSYLGTRYKYGGTTRKGMDCSGFVTVVFREVYNKQLPRSSGQMWKEGISVAVTAARPGDLVFFKTKGGRIDHVGIYMGDYRFIHSSTSKGVIYSDMKDPYYKKRFAGVRRVI